MKSKSPEDYKSDDPKCPDYVNLNLFLDYRYSL